MNAADRLSFLDLLGDTAAVYNLVIHAYCLMSNHYHLLMETPDANLSQAMRQINGVYTQKFNRTHGRTGHVFQGRFKSIVVDKDAYLAELSRYIVLNPVRAGMVDQPGDYRWSNYRAYVGSASRPPWLHVEWILQKFGKDKATARQEYVRFVAAGEDRPFPGDQILGQALLGGKGFMEKIKQNIASRPYSKEVVVKSRLLNRPSLDACFSSVDIGNKNARNAAIFKAHVTHGYKQKEIAEHLRLHYTTVSNLIKRLK